MRSQPLSTWDLLALAGVSGLAFFYQRLLPLLPDPVPTHFDFAGRANGWTPKAHLHWLVFGLPLAAWLILLLVAVVAVRAAKDPVLARVNAFPPLRGFLVLGFCVLAGSTLLIPLQGLVALKMGLAGLLLGLAAGVALLVRDVRAALLVLPDGQFYRWGVIYVNPEDPRLWVEKRFGIGWTLNYARPAAWWVTALILLIPAAVLILAFRGR